MILTINEQDYNVRFGIGFMRKMDEKYFTTGVGGTRFGIGLEVAIPKLQSGDVAILQEMIYLGIEEKKPSQNDMDDFIDTHEDIEGLIDEVMNELKNSNASRLRVKSVLETTTEDEKKS